MATDPKSSPSSLRIFLRVLRLEILVAALLWAGGFAIFLSITLPMDNAFAEYAREHHKLTALMANLRTLPGYLILAVAYAALAFPLIGGHRSFREPRGRIRRVTAVALLLVANLLIFILSLGPTSLSSPAFLDTLSRYLSPHLPGLNFYRIYDWHLAEVFLGGFLLLVALAAWTYLRGAFRLSRRSRLPAFALVVLAIGIIAAALPHRDAPPRGGSRKGPPNVLIIGADSLRADHLSCYGYGRETSPNIDRLAAEGIVFENLTVATASTLESWISILYSRFPVSHDVRYMYPSRERVEVAAADPDTLPRLLEGHGYHTAVSSNWVGNCFSLVDMGFAANRASDVQNLRVFIDEAALIAHISWPLYFNNDLGRLLYPAIDQLSSYLDPSELQHRITEEFDAARREHKPFFGILFESTTHLPYAASYPFNLKWIDPEYRGPNRYQIDFEVDGFICAGFREALAPDEVQHILDLYDGAVSEFDDDVGRVIRWLEDEGVFENTIIVITSDHGDDLYEPGTTLGHGINFFGGDQTTRIPFIVRLPGARAAGTRIDQITRNVDVAPTLLELLDLPVPESFEGVSLVPAIEDPTVSLDLPAFSETCYLFFPKKVAGEEVLAVEDANRTLAIDPDFDDNFVIRDETHQPVIDTKDRMMRTRRWKLIHIPGRHGPIIRLYDMLADPGQTTNVADRHPELLARMRHHLDAYWEGRTDLRWTPEDDEP